jgi:hypothetical protein
MSTPFPKEAIRQAIRDSLPEIEPPSKNVACTYVPPSHARALDPEKTLVEGIRGAGKSFWWLTLASEPHRKYIASVFPEARIRENIEISQGFGMGQGMDPAKVPSQDTLSQLAETFAPRHIWRAVVAVHLNFPVPFPLNGKWADKVGWVQANPEDYDTLLYQADQALTDTGRIRLILFDALDRLADSWPEIRPLAKALFQVALDLRSCRSIRAKLFVRPDMLEDREITQFPDSSKLTGQKVSLSWKRTDLYALLFQCVGNAKAGGEAFRQHCQQEFHLTWQHERKTDTWIIPRSLRIDEDIQKAVFHAVAGPAMASGPSGHKRGFPYTWLVNHLMDGRGQVSPRSFSAALRHAAEQENPDNWKYALHYKAIEEGVKDASRIRVDEISREDYPWVGKLMSPLKEGRIIVPCAAEDITETWRQENILSSLAENGQNVKLPPQRLAEGEEGVLSDIAELGLIQRLRDGRIQMPDVYRLGFGLGRKGGVKPLK